MRRDDICLYVSPANRSRLEAIVADRNSSSKAVWRAGIVLATADGLGTNAIMQRTGKSKPCVWRWQERYIEEGVDGLLRDKTRPPRQEAAVGGRSSARCWPRRRARRRPKPRTGACASMAAEMGISHTSVQRIWAEAGLKPHLVGPVQDLERPAVRGEGHRRRRPVHEPAGQGAGAVRGREEPDPGARSHAAGPALEEGPRRDHDARLQAPRHDHAVCRARHEERPRHRRLPAAPSREGVHPLPEADRPMRDRSTSTFISWSTTTGRTRRPR